MSEVTADEVPAAEALASEPAPPAAPPQAVEYPFEFSGDAHEYFRIWIVNLALTIVTLGIYSAWAKVRTQRYFYANTRVAGAPFEYLAQPLPILKGRAIAFVVFGAYSLSRHISPQVQLAMALVIFFLVPVLIVLGQRFRARYSAWRSLNFSFVGTIGRAYVPFFLMYFLVPITLFVFYPFMKAKQQRFLVENHRYGGAALAFRAYDGDFFTPYLKGFGLMLVWMVISTFASGAIMAAAMHGAKMPSPVAIYAAVALVYGGMFAVGIYVVSRVTNLLYNNIDIGGHRLSSTLGAFDLMGLYFTNTLAILASAGMLIPWAMIRMARYRASRLTLVAHGDLDAFAAEASAERGAAGAELGHLFDVEIGF
jgi:uncharacterized membrane protein YjgN (DUF898 family)